MGKPIDDTPVIHDHEHVYVCQDCGEIGTSLAMNSQTHSLDIVFNKPARKSAFYTEGEIRPRLEALIAEHERRARVDCIEGFKLMLEADLDRPTLLNQMVYQLKQLRSQERESE